MYLFLPGLQNFFRDILEKNNIEFPNDEKWALSQMAIITSFCYAVCVCERDVSPQHFQFKVRDQSTSYSACGGWQHRSASHGPEGTVSILFHFLLRVSSSLSFSFPSPAVPDIAPGQARNQDRCPGWNDLLQCESWILPQRHLLRSQPVGRGRVSFILSEGALRNARADSCSVMWP